MLEQSSWLTLHYQFAAQHSEVPHGGAAMGTIPRALETLKMMQNIVHSLSVQRLANHD